MTHVTTSPVVKANYLPWTIMLLNNCCIGYLSLNILNITQSQIFQSFWTMVFLLLAFFHAFTSSNKEFGNFEGQCIFATHLNCQRKMTPFRSCFSFLRYGIKRMSNTVPAEIPQFVCTYLVQLPKILLFYPSTSHV